MLSKSRLEKFCCIHNKIESNSLDSAPVNLIQIMTSCFHGNVSKADMINDIRQFVANDSFAQLFNKKLCLVDECDKPTSTSHAVYVIFWIVVLILITCSNLLVIVSVARLKFLRSSVANLFILSLAVSDLLVGLCIVPIKINDTLHNQKFCSSMTVCRYYLTTDMAFFSTSVTNLFVIAVDRYIALNYPYKYPTLVTRKRALIVIFSIWCYGMAWGLLVNFNWGNPNEPAIIINSNTCASNKNVYFIFTMFIQVFLIPVIAMGGIYLRILMIARRHALGIATATTTCNNNPSIQLDAQILLSPEQGTFSVPGASPSPILRIRNYLNVERSGSRSSSTSSTGKNHIVQYRKMVFKATKTVATVYGAFVITWSPLWFISIALVVCESCFRENYKWYYVIFVESLPIISSMVNPCIYALMNKQYRKAFKIMLNCGIFSKAFSYIGQRERSVTESAIL